MTTFLELKRNLKKDFSGLKPFSLALLGDSATQMLAMALRGYGHDVGLDLRVYDADYDQIEAQILNRSSELYAEKRDGALIFRSTPHLKADFYKLPVAERASFADDQLQRLAHLHETLQAGGIANVMVCNFLELDDGVFGQFANKLPTSFRYQLRKLNLGLMELGAKYGSLFVVDLQALHAQHGTAQVIDEKVRITSDILFSLDFMPVAAKAVVDIVLAVSGRVNKCLILDLDNTCWGGVIGDDGLENIHIGRFGIGKVFTEIQRWAKALKERGIILAVCSKNDEAIARTPFEQHPEMVLRIDDIAVFVANWENKVDNIRLIQETLNIGFDSLVFVDDNPVERASVKTFLPEVNVPDLPEDPAEYLPFLSRLNLFETASFSDNDTHRTKQYQEEAKRKIFEKSFFNEGDFLSQLEMSATVREFDDFSVPRVAQLIQRSNQFNLRTQRYSEDEVRKMASAQTHLTRSFTLKDKFGDHGLISAAILRKDPRFGQDSFFIDTWIMSCRVLKRGMEGFVLNELAAAARAAGAARLVGEYLPTKKNALVKDHYKDLGFEAKDGVWVLDLAQAEPRPVHIGRSDSAGEAHA
jgi:FkbH-like protein